MSTDDQAGPTEIRANTALPARREPITLHTADGLRLVGVDYPGDDELAARAVLTRRRRDEPTAR